MEWNIAAEAISLVMMGIIWVYARKGSHLPTLKNRIFQWCLLVTFSAMLTNILSTILIHQYRRVPMGLTWTVTTVYYILTPLMGLAYFLYAVSVIYTESLQVKKIMAVGMIPGALYAVMVLANPFNKLLFDINSREGYTRGSLVSVTYLIFMPIVWPVSCSPLRIIRKLTVIYIIFLPLSLFWLFWSLSYRRCIRRSFCPALRRHVPF